MTIQPASQPPLLSPGAANKPSKAPFWIGFVLGFALLALASCGGVAFSLGLGGLTLNDLRRDASSWTPPTLAPTPEFSAPSTPAPGGVTDGRFSAGQTVRNVTNSQVNLRATPGHLGKPAGDVLALLKPGNTVVIQGDASQADNLIWWRVRANGIEGWVAEATASGVQILGE
jgi:hypothetical protein